MDAFVQKLFMKAKQYIKNITYKIIFSHPTKK